MAEQPMKCGTCDKPLTLAAARYVHADGKTYRHVIRPVPGDGTPPRMTQGGPVDPRDNQALNAIADVLTERFGFLPLSVRYNAARKALDAARAGYSLHGDISTPNDGSSGHG